jgi:uncharacterized iron-regulated membrane protein
VAESRDLRDVAWDVHSWVGAAIALAAFVFFFGGIFALHRDALHAWERPSERAVYAGPPASIDTLLRGVFAQHDLRGQDVHIELPSETEPYVEVHWGEHDPIWIEPATGELISKRDTSHAVDMLYELHCLEPIPLDIGLGISGLVGLLVVISVITGIVVHVRMRKELFQFRPERSARAAWTDAHKVLGTFGIPFGIVAAFTGALIGLGHLYFHAVVAWGGGIEVFSADLRPPEPVIRESAPAPYPFSVDVALATARGAWPDIPIDQVRVTKAGAPESTTTVSVRDPSQLIGGADAFGDGLLMFESATGIERSRAEPRVAYSTTSTLWQLMTKLHYARYGSNATKLAYTLLGVAFCASIAIGLVLWLETRRRRFPLRLARYRRIDRARIGVMVGLLVASAAMFMANRLAPAFEQQVFYGTWLGAVIYAFLRERASRELFTIAGVLSLGLPIANGVTTGDWLGQGGHHAVFWVDMTAVIAGVASLGWAHLAHRNPRQARSR